VAGWHFCEALFAQLAEVPRLTVFVVSHRPARQMPAWLTRYIPTDRIFIEPNVGYDWGCYQQFLEKGAWRAFAAVFFMHDDVAIRDRGFVGASLDLLAQGHRVVGNGRNSSHRAWPRTHTERYAHSRWLPPSLDFEHDTVRGSFFVAARETLEAVGRLEIFWDRFHLNIRFGNWSMTPTCGRIQEMFGERAFAFLSEKYRASAYVDEYERGEAGSGSDAPISPWRRRLLGSFQELCRNYVRRRMGFGHTWRDALAQRMVAPIVRLFSGR